MTLRTQIAVTTILSAFLAGSGSIALAKQASYKIAQQVDAENIVDVEDSFQITEIEEANSLDSENSDGLSSVDATGVDATGVDSSDEGVDVSGSLDEAEIDPLGLPTGDLLPSPDSEASDLVPAASESELEALPDADLSEGELQEPGLPDLELEDSDPADADLEDVSGDVGEPEELSLEGLQQSAKLSLKEALEIVAVETEGAESARSAMFIGNLTQPVIAVEVGLQAIAIDANAGEVLKVQEIREIPDPDLLAAAEAATTLRSFAKVSLKQAIEAAESFAGQEVQQVALGLDEGSLVYRATIAEQEIFVDAGDAEVLYTSDDALEEGNKPSGSIQISELEGTSVEESVN